MQSALKLAEKGISSVEPNPAVGCIIIKAGQLIGKGYHKKFGGPHAEVNALEDCRTLGMTPEGGTMYVTLEPCCHQGKTGPCTQAIIGAGIARVIAATIDPSEHANGKGMEQLRQAGIEVEVGLCEQEARLLNAPFFKYVTTGKPWVVLKWAQSLDGKLAYADQSAEKRWITNEASRNDAHRLRRRVGAIAGRNQHGPGGRSAADASAEQRPHADARCSGRCAQDSAPVPACCERPKRARFWSTRTKPPSRRTRNTPSKSATKARRCSPTRVPARCRTCGSCSMS